MKAFDILAYAYDADMHCLDCACARFGDALDNPETVDSEGNPLFPLFAFNVEQEETCGDCGDVISGTEQETRKREAKLMLWLDEPRGIYIPRDFAHSFKDRDSCVTGVTAWDWKILEAGREHECYWETWDDVCSNAVVTDPDSGTKYTVWQDGACWLVEQGAEWDETGEISETGWYIEE